MVAGLAAGAVGLAGCSRVPNAGDSGTDAVAVAEEFDGTPDRPECEVDSEPVEVEIGGDTREYETAATIPYPDSPTAFDEDAIVEYVTAFEEAYVVHAALCDQSGSSYVIRINYDVDRIETFERSGTGATVFLRYAGGATSGVDDGGLWQADIGYRNVVYTVDETGAARAAFDDSRDPDRDAIESEAPDPIDDGDLVAVFD